MSAIEFPSPFSTQPGDDPSPPDAAGIAEGVPVLNFPLQHIGDRLNPPVRVQRKPGLIIHRVAGGKVVEQQEGIKIVQGRRADASLEPDPCAFNDRFGLNELFEVLRMWPNLL